MRFHAIVAAFLVACACILPGRAEQRRDANVIVVTLDGMRWQEVFGGADRDYFEKKKDGQPGDAEKRFWRPTAEARRTALMPFLWQTIATKGQIVGDPSRQSRVHVTNGLWFSYPGYNEMFSGAPDPRVGSNDKVPNPNVTVLEWLNNRPAFQHRVAAFGSWDVLPYILNTARSGIPVGWGFHPVPSPATDRQRGIDELAGDLPPYWGYGPFDAPIVYAALDCLRTQKPRVLYVMLGETDEWAHEGKYDLYLDAAHRSDAFIRRIWEAAQAMPEYANHTTLLVTTDHGRGATTIDWKDHGRKIPAAEDTWMAVMGPGAPALGVHEGVTATTSQFAATIAAVVGEDFRSAAPNAAPPLTGIAPPEAETRGAPQPKIERPPIAGLAHIRIQTSDIAKARAFYGALLGFEEVPQSFAGVAIFKVNDRQHLIVRAGLPPDRPDRFVDVAFETTDIRAARAFLTSRGIEAGAVAEDGEGAGQSIATRDPDGHAVRLIQIAPFDPILAKGPDRRISHRILHTGLTIRDAAAADRFYKDVLGFSEIWRGGPDEGVTSWINMRVPNGTDYLEYMLMADPRDRRRLGSAHHVALLVSSIQDALETVRARTPADDPNHRAIPQIGRNRKWQMNLFDPDGTRIELMEPWPMR